MAVFEPATVKSILKSSLSQKERGTFEKDWDVRVSGHWIREKKKSTQPELQGIKEGQHMDCQPRDAVSSEAATPVGSGGRRVCGLCAQADHRSWECKNRHRRANSQEGYPNSRSTFRATNLSAC